jgi:hypothetical protein|eukprot:1125087-Prymnesium_polylepis.1
MHLVREGGEDGIGAQEDPIGNDVGGKSGGLKRLNFPIAKEKPQVKTQKSHMKRIRPTPAHGG